MSSLYGNFRQLKFDEVYENAENFLNDYNSLGIPPILQDEENAKTLYFLLYSRYGNSTIASSDINRFKFNLFSIIWQYGGTWEKRLQIQAKLRSLSLDEESEIYKGSKAIYNQAINPSVQLADESTSTDGELTFINGQNVTKYKKSVLDGLSYLNDLLATDVTGEFLNKFKKLFLVIVEPEKPLWYVTEGDI